MAAVEVTITGMLYDKTARTTQNVVLVGEASLTGLEVGGGPMPGGPGRPPLGIWGGGGVPMPTPPIHLGPGGEPLPPQVGGGPIYPGMPAHPIVLPPPNGGAPGVPAHPIVIPPGQPGYPAHPIVIPPGQPGVPAHPIVLPPTPPDVSPAPPDMVVKPPPAEGGWAYVSTWGGWGYFPGVGQPGPKR